MRFGAIRCQQLDVVEDTGASYVKVLLLIFSNQHQIFVHVKPLNPVSNNRFMLSIVV